MEKNETNGGNKKLLEQYKITLLNAGSTENFSDEIVKLFYGNEGTELVLKRKIAPPSYEEVAKYGLFKNHHISNFLGEEKFEQWYRKNPLLLRDLYTSSEDILHAQETYGLNRELLEGFFSLDYNGRPQLRDILVGDEGRLKTLYSKIHAIGVKEFIACWSANDNVRHELIGTINLQTASYYDDDEFNDLLTQLFA